MKDNLYTNLQVREGIIRGIQKCASAVGATMGTAGSNAIIEAMENPGYLLTNDGISILRSIYFSDPIENIGRRILLDAVERANKQSGDGSSTATVLTASIIEEGKKYIEESAPMDIKRSLEECSKLIEDSIKRQARKIEINDVSKVATISAEDREIGNLIQEIYQKIGKEGIIHWDISKTAKDYYTVQDGLIVEGAGIASPYMNDQDKQTGVLLSQAKLKDPKVIITREKLTTAGVFGKIFENLNNKGFKDVVVFCDDFDAQVVAQFIATHQARGFRTVIVKMPVLWADQWREDLSLASGATIIDPTAGLNLSKMTEEHLGTFGNITITKDTTYIDGIKDLSAHIDRLKDGNDDEKLRASRLNTKTARYFVGAQSESALSHRRLKVEDAISAAYQALHGGVVAGGGVAMLNAAKEIISDDVGSKIVREALKSPILKIMSNARIDSSRIINCGGNMGYDTRTGELVDMFANDIVNPANIEINAVKNAISVAATALTVNTITALPRQENQLMQPPITL